MEILEFENRFFQKSVFVQTLVYTIGYTRVSVVLVEVGVVVVVLVVVVVVVEEKMEEITRQNYAGACVRSLFSAEIARCSKTAQ